MHTLIFGILLTVSTSLYAQIGIQDRPCDFVQGMNNLTLDFGGFCKYEQSNVTLPEAGPQRVVYLGDSITQMWSKGIVGLDQNDTINRGYSGQTTSQMLVRFRADVIKLKPRIVHIMAGTNDIAGNTGPTTLERIKDNLRTMCELAQMNGIRVVIGSVLPASYFSWRTGMKPADDIRALNKWIATYAQNSGFVFADYHSAMTDADGGLPVRYSADGVHPNQAGFDVMRPIAAEAIARANKN